VEQAVELTEGIREGKGLSRGNGGVEGAEVAEGCKRDIRPKRGQMAIRWQKAVEGTQGHGAYRLS
jgi:hypothetical protein